MSAEAEDELEFVASDERAQWGSLIKGEPKDAPNGVLIPSRRSFMTLYVPTFPRRIVGTGCHPALDKLRRQGWRQVAQHPFTVSQDCKLYARNLVFFARMGAVARLFAAHEIEALHSMQTLLVETAGGALESALGALAQDGWVDLCPEGRRWVDLLHRCHVATAVQSGYGPEEFALLLRKDIASMSFPKPTGHGTREPMAAPLQSAADLTAHMRALALSDAMEAAVHRGNGTWAYRLLHRASNALMASTEGGGGGTAVTNRVYMCMCRRGVGLLERERKYAEVRVGSISPFADCRRTIFD